MHPIETYHHLGLIAAVILLIGLYGVVRLWPQGHDKTFSQHVAINNKGIIYYITLFTLTLPLLLLFFIGWFAPTFNLPLSFRLALIAAVVFQYLCALIPERNVVKRTLHRLLAFASGASLLISLIVTVLSGEFSLTARIILTGAALAMSTVIVLFINTKGHHPKALILQAVYFGVFFAGILTVTYLP